MALRLSQVLDLAIGVDNASVNLLHLREVLLTVITTLDIAHVTVRKCEEFEDNIEREDELESNDTDPILPEQANDETQENSFPSTDKGLFYVV